MKELFEIFQVKVHKPRVVVFVLVGKETETVMLVESRGNSKCINSYKSAPCTISVCKDKLNTIKYKATNTLPCISFINGQSTYFYRRVVVALFTERNFAIDTIANTLLRFVQSNDIVKETIISNDITISCIAQQVCFSQQLSLVVFGFFNQKIVQVAFSALERCQIIFWCQIQQVKITFNHLNNEQFGELRLNVSYAIRALSLSSSDTGDGWDMCQRKRSASLPVNTGVSLIGLAIIILLSFYFVAKLRIKTEIPNIYGTN